MKKAQTKQIFVFIIALVIFAGIVFFGYRAVQDFIQRGEQVAFVGLKNSLEQSIKTISTEYGSVTVYDSTNPLTVPTKYKKVCFVDYDRDPSLSTICDTNSEDYNPLACDVWETDWDTARGWQSGDENVFLEPQGLSAITVSKIVLEDGKPNLCFTVITGRMDFRIEGRGDSTLISR